MARARRTGRARPHGDDPTATTTGPRPTVTVGARALLLAAAHLAFQLSPDHEPPVFPDPHGSQQFHLDVEVDDVDRAESAVLELGASRVTDAPGEENFRVFRDPSGHPFCLVFDVTPD